MLCISFGRCCCNCSFKPEHAHYFSIKCYEFWLTILNICWMATSLSINVDVLMHCHVHYNLNIKNRSAIILIWEGQYIFSTRKHRKNMPQNKTAMYLKAVLKYFDVAKEILHVVFLLVKTIVFAHIFKQTIHFIVHIVQYFKLVFSITYKTVTSSRKRQFW